MKTGAPPDHIVVVIEENHGYSQIIGNSDAPYINSLAAAGTLFTNYRGAGHPSAPNYLALFSGSTQGITEDGTYFFPNTPTLASELQRAGYSFVGYAEPPIDRDHNPWLSFGDLEGVRQAFSEFPTDFGKLPTVSFVIPNPLHDMHDGSVTEGDRWLQANSVLRRVGENSIDSLLVVTFDEDQGTTNNQVATIVFGAGAGDRPQQTTARPLRPARTIEIVWSAVSGCECECSDDGLCSADPEITVTPARQPRAHPSAPENWSTFDDGIQRGFFRRLGQPIN